MKSTIAALLAVTLASPAYTAAAQDGHIATSGAIALAITRESVRLASEPQTKSTDAAWARVRKLDVGTAISVTLKESRPGARYFVRADDSTLVVAATRFGREFETFTRTDVAELTSPAREGGHTALLASLGAIGGFVAGVAMTATKREEIGRASCRERV